MNSSNQDVILFYLKFSLIFWAALGLVVACGIFCCKGRLLSGCGMWTPDWACLVVACGAWAWLPHRMWGLSFLTRETMSPALEAGFLITGPPGKSAGYDILLQ